MPARKIPPPDFRYVWLAPASTSLVAAAGATAGVVSTGVCITTFGDLAPLSVAVTVGVGALAAAIVLRGRSLRVRGSSRPVAMAIVPWGVVVEPDADARILRWPGIRRVKVQSEHVLRGGIPSIVSSLVTIETAREVLVARGKGAVGLERLTANLGEYANEAARPAARDLDGMSPLTSEIDEPVVARLLQIAQVLCTTGRGAARLSLPLAGYRDCPSRAASQVDARPGHGSMVASPETIAELRAALSPPSDAPADPRPLAAIVAACLEARALVPDLLRLVSAPNPLVAAVAKVAAVRLGAPFARAGSIHEVAPFLMQDDLEALEAWVSAPGQVQVDPDPSCGQV